MANGHVAAAGTAAVLIGVLAAVEPVTAEPASVATVVFHVRDYRPVPANEMSEAQRLAARVYARVGVALVWAGGTRAHAAADGFFHVELIILDGRMTARNNPEHTAFGQAAHTTKRAYIYYPRIHSHARQTQSDPARALAVVFAHELEQCCCRNTAVRLTG